MLVDCDPISVHFCEQDQQVRDYSFLLSTKLPLVLFCLWFAHFFTYLYMYSRNKYLNCQYYSYIFVNDGAVEINVIKAMQLSSPLLCVAVVTEYE